MLGGLSAFLWDLSSSSFASRFGICLGIGISMWFLGVGVGQLVCVIASKVDVT